jgi:hypothetical protein
MFLGSKVRPVRRTDTWQPCLHLWADFLGKVWSLTSHNSIDIRGLLRGLRKSPLKVNRRFGITCSLVLLCQRITQARNHSESLHGIASQKMELIITIDVRTSNQLRSYLKENVAAAVWKAENTALGILDADHVATSIRKRWHLLRRQGEVARSV